MTGPSNSPPMMAGVKSTTTIAASSSGLASAVSGERSFVPGCCVEEDEDERLHRDAAEEVAGHELVARIPRSPLLQR